MNFWLCVCVFLSRVSRGHECVEFAAPASSVRGALCSSGLPAGSGAEVLSRFSSRSCTAASFGWDSDTPTLIKLEFGTFCFNSECLLYEAAEPVRLWFWRTCNTLFPFFVSSVFGFRKLFDRPVALPVAGVGPHLLCAAGSLFIPSFPELHQQVRLFELITARDLRLY